MTYSYERVERRSRMAAGGGYHASSRRSTLGYWVPLVMTVSIATMGLAAWIWSERRDDDEESSEEESNHGNLPPPADASMSGALPPFQGPPPSAPSVPGDLAGSSMPPPDPGYEGGARSTAAETQMQDESTLMAKMSGALKRTPSPQQSYDWASKKVAAGVAAAGAMVGGALGTIREGSQDDYEDHERWSEEADGRDNGKDVRRGLKRRGTADDYFSGAVEMPKSAAIRLRKRKSVAVVVSAVENSGDDVAEFGNHAVSCSPWLHRNSNSDRCRVDSCAFARICRSGNHQVLRSDICT